MRRHTPKALFLTFWLLPLSGGCKAKIQQAHVNYSILAAAPKRSMLIDIDKTGVMPICIRPKIPSAVKEKVTELDVAKRIQEVMALAQMAAQTWFDALADNPTWKQKKVQYQFFRGEHECKNMPSHGVTIVTDVGEGRFKYLEKEGKLVLDPDCVDFYFKESDGRLCRAYARLSLREIHIASAGQSGNIRVITHELGHIFGLGDIYDEKGYQTGFEDRNDGSIMGSDNQFCKDDALGINGVWSMLNGGVACVGGTAANANVNEGYNVKFRSLHCASKSVPPKIVEQGKSLCPQGFQMSPLQICVEYGWGEKIVCPSEIPDYDLNWGVCCPAGKSFDTGIMACEFREVMARKYPSKKME